MNVIKKIICLVFLFSISLCGTIYISSSLDGASEQEGFMSEDFINSTLSLGYYDTVWEKRKTSYSINLGLDITANDNFNFISFYSMFNYKFSKSFSSSVILGIDFFDHEYILNNNEIYHPDAKGGAMYGLSLSYLLTKSLPVSLDYKVFNASEAQSDQWVDLIYEKVAVNLGYEF